MSCNGNCNQGRMCDCERDVEIEDVEIEDDPEFWPIVGVLLTPILFVALLMLAGYVWREVR